MTAICDARLIYGRGRISRVFICGGTLMETGWVQPKPHGRSALLVFQWRYCSVVIIYMYTHLKLCLTTQRDSNMLTLEKQYQNDISYTGYLADKPPWIYFQCDLCFDPVKLRVSVLIWCYQPITDVCHLKRLQ